MGGNAWNELVRDNALFLDVLAVLQNEDLHSVLLEWAAAEGLIEVRTLWKAWSYDDESDRWGYMLMETVADAVEHLDPDAGEGSAKSPSDFTGPEGHEAIEPALVPTGNEKLAALTGMKLRPDEDASDAVVMAWAEAVLPGLIGREIDGIWWREDYDPGGLSAPRGAIFPSAVVAWKARQVPPGSIDDDEGLEAMPDTEIELAGSSPTPA